MNTHRKTPYGFIYITECLIDGKRYIGQRRYRGRWKTYIGSGDHLLRAIKKYGRANFKRTDVYVAFDLDELNRAEIAFIAENDAVNDPMWYNISPGGRGRTKGFTGRKHKPETIEKMRQSQKGHSISEKVRKAVSETGKKWGKLTAAIRKGNGTYPTGKDHPRSKSVTINGVVYESLQAAANATGIAYRHIRAMSLDPTFVIGVNSRTIWIDGIRYKSIPDAMRILGWPRSKVCRHISDPS